MKVSFRIPTEMYSFVEPVIDMPEDTTAEKIREVYDELAAAFKPKPENSLGDKEYNAFIDRQLTGEANHVEEYNQMSPQQKDAVQIIKRSLKRIESRESKLPKI